MRLLNLLSPDVFSPVKMVANALVVQGSLQHFTLRGWTKGKGVERTKGNGGHTREKGGKETGEG